MTDLKLDPVHWASLADPAEAHVDSWLAAEGDAVRAGQPLARVAAGAECLELLAPHTGRLEQVLIAEGERVEPHHVLARLIPL